MRDSCSPERSLLSQSKHVRIKHVQLISLTESNFDPLVNTPWTEREAETQTQPEEGVCGIWFWGTTRRSGSWWNQHINQLLFYCCFYCTAAWQTMVSQPYTINRTGISSEGINKASIIIIINKLEKYQKRLIFILSTVFLSSQKASQVLVRNRRANQMFEELKPGNVFNNLFKCLNEQSKCLFLWSTVH